MNITICKIDHQSKFDAWNRILKAGALEQLRGMGLGGRWQGVLGWRTHIHLWLIHVNVWQKPPQHCKVISLQLKYRKKKNNEQGKKILQNEIILWTWNIIFKEIFYFKAAYSKKLCTGTEKINTSICPWYCTAVLDIVLYSKAHKSTTTCRGCTYVTIYARHVN